MFLLPGLNAPFLFPTSKVWVATLLLTFLFPNFEASGAATPSSRGTSHHCSAWTEPSSVPQHSE